MDTIAGLIREFPNGSFVIILVVLFGTAGLIRSFINRNKPPTPTCTCDCCCEDEEDEEEE